MTRVKVNKLERRMNQDDYDNLNKLIHDNYTVETGETLKGEILPYRTEVGITLPEQKEDKVLIHLIRASYLEDINEDVGAFESLAFLIRRWTEFSQISLRWDYPNDSGHHAPEYYQAFLYRVSRFSECYPWFSIDESSKRLMGKMLIVSQFELLLDHPRYDAYRNLTTKPIDQLNSDDIEEYIWSHPHALKKLVDTKEISRGLPLRVYLEYEPENIYLFPKKYGMIDLWGLSNDTDILSIFKLYGIRTESRLSIITELFFNSMVMRDIISGPFIYPEEAGKVYIGRGEYFNIPRARAINSYLLCGDLTGLIDEKVIRDMNDIESPDIPIRFGYISIDSNFNMKRIL